MNTCEICKISCTGSEQYQQHMIGAKHRKKAAEIAAQARMNSNVELSKGNDISTNGFNMTICENQKFGTNHSLESVMNAPGYFCRICNIPCSGPLNYQQHMYGKNHLKKVALQGQENLFLSSSVKKFGEKSEMDTFKPIDSCVSEVLEDRLKTVKELASVPNKETMYNYCNICHIPCSGISSYQQHIQGKAHLKQIATYEAQRNSKFYKINSESLSCPVYNSTSVSPSFKQINAPNLINSVEEIIDIKKQPLVEKSEDRGEMCISSDLNNYYVNKSENILKTVQDFHKNSSECVTSDYTPVSLSSSKHSNSKDLRNAVEEAMLEIEKKGQKSFYCEICNVPCTGNLSYEQHVKGDKHRKKRNIYFYEHYTNKSSDECILNTKIDYSTSLSKFSEIKGSLATSTNENKLGQLVDFPKAKCKSMEYEQHIVSDVHQINVLSQKLQNIELNDKFKISAEPSFSGGSLENFSQNLTDESKLFTSSLCTTKSNETVIDKPNTFCKDSEYNADTNTSNIPSEFAFFIPRNPLEVLTNTFKISIIEADEEIVFD